MLIGLSIRLGISVLELERLPIPVIREYMAMLGELNKPPEKPAITDDEIKAGCAAAFGMKKTLRTNG